VNLAQGGGGEGSGVEVCEALLEGAAEFGLDDAPYFLEGDSWGFVLEEAQFSDSRGREKIAAGAEELAELDEGGA